LSFRNSYSYCGTAPAEAARRSRKRPGTATLLASALLFALVCLAGSPAYGDVGVVLNESLDTSVARITGSGHTAVYFSRICPESPVKLRLCRPDEQGSVMSNYISLGEDQAFEWNLVPLNVYLYGVEDPRYRPLVGSQKIKHALEERYRENYLDGLCAGEFCRTSNNAEWREMVAATLERSMYMFVIHTTVEQDQQLIEQFNSLPNENHFNGVTRNCADFARRVINSYFPGATGPDYINDFGMTSPKAIARSFTRYAERHPEAQFRVLHYAQVPGTIKRSKDCRAGTEQLVRSKKLLVPMVIFAHYALPFVAASYLVSGRFNPQRELEDHPTVKATEAEHQLRAAKAENDEVRAQQLEAEHKRERARIVGTPQEWKEYRTAFEAVVAEAVQEERIPERGHLNRVFRRFDKAGTPVADSHGALWMEFSENGETSQVGLSASNVVAPTSDTQLAHELVLARVRSVLNSPKHSRENMVEFKQDWLLLQHARANNLADSGLSRTAQRSVPATGIASSQGTN
jgi:hypothetical protein